jgi:hypothetical protein
MTVETPDGDCDCMDYDEAVALMSQRTIAELRAAREVVKYARLADHAVDLIGTTDYARERRRQLSDAIIAYDQAVRGGV